MAPPDHPYAEELRTKAKELGISDRVHMTGLITGPAKAGGLASCWTFACPSYLESFGMAVAEGLSYGKPVLISDKVKIRLEVQDGDAGVISSTGPTSIAEKLREMDAWSDEEYQAKCANAKNCYESNFTAEGSAEDVTNFILDALGKKA
ncbi:MAG: glycosyltransferase [Fimbriimonadaceae bacterium]